MGVDLRLLPFDCDHDDFAFSHTLLELGRNYELHAQIRQLNQFPVPSGFTSFSGRSANFDDICYGTTVSTPYGEDLTYTTAGELCQIPKNYRAEWERPVWAYLDALSPETKVALYWH